MKKTICLGPLYKINIGGNRNHKIRLYCLLANSANNKRRLFQVKINCSKFTIGWLQEWCYVTFLIYLYVAPRNLSFGIFLSRKIIIILRKIDVNFKQVLLKGVTSLSKLSGMFRQNLLKVPVKKLKL